MKKAESYFRVKPAPYEEVSSFSGGLAAVKSNGKWGYVDKNGNMAIPAVYDSADSFQNGVAGVVLNGQARVIDAKGNTLLETEYEDISSYHYHSAGYFNVMAGGKWGCIDASGRVTVPVRYDFVMAFSEGLAQVGAGCYENGHKRGFVNLAGEEAIPLIYDDLENFDGGFAEACIDDKWGLIDKAGKISVPLIYKRIIHHDGLVAFEVDKGWGLMDTTGNILAPPRRYSKVYIYDKNRIWAREGGRNGKCGVIAPDGTEIIPVIYDDLHIEGDITGARRYGKCGYLDNSGNVAIPFVYDEAGEFADGRAMVKRGGKYGMIDKGGNIIVPFEYDNINYDTNENSGGLMFGYKGRGKGQKMFLLDKDGQVLLSINPDRQYPFSEGMAWVQVRGGKLWGAIGREHSDQG